MKRNTIYADEDGWVNFGDMHDPIVPEKLNGSPENIAVRADYIYNSSIIDYVNSENLQALLNIDMERIVSEFNKRNYKVLYQPEAAPLFSLSISRSTLVSEITRLKESLRYKKFFLDKVENAKIQYAYSDDAVFTSAYIDHANEKRQFTYGYIFGAFERAEQFLNDENTYQLLDFLLKYQDTIDQLQQRKKVLDTIRDNPQGMEELFQAINKRDDSIGIIVINGYYIKTRIVAGTKQDMELSELLGLPFPKDEKLSMVLEGGEIPNKIEKTFYEQGETDFHHRIIANENHRRLLLKRQTTRGMGYIISGNKALIVSRQSLTSRGLDPERLGWQPMRVTITPKTLKDVTNWNWRTRIEQKRLLRKKNN